MNKPGRPVGTPQPASARASISRARKGNYRGPRVVFTPDMEAAFWHGFLASWSLGDCLAPKLGVSPDTLRRWMRNQLGLPTGAVELHRVRDAIHAGARWVPGKGLEK